MHIEGIPAYRMGKEASPTQGVVAELEHGPLSTSLLSRSLLTPWDWTAGFGGAVVVKANEREGGEEDLVSSVKGRNEQA